MKDNIDYSDQLLRLIRALIDAKIAQEPEFKVTRNTIKETVKSETVKLSFHQIKNASETTINTLCRHIETYYNIDQPTGFSIASNTYKKWFDSKKGEIDFHYWERFSSWLRSDGKIPTKVVIKLDQITDKIVDYAGDPNEKGNWERKGLIIGQVQSGKTTNYSGVICKAADAGYKVIVLLAGISNNLRKQTQERINEAFIGKNTTSLVGGGDITVIGAARHTQNRPRHPQYFTTLERDFNQANAGGAQGVDFTLTKEPTIFVCKKNVNVLKMLNNYFENYSNKKKIPVPLLLIDDEADNASINTSKNKNIATKTNEAIRNVLVKFNRSSYIGYTATPFANIFIEPNSQEDMEKEDLFPSDYIYALEPPTNYIGPEKIFGEKDEEISDRMINIIDDFENNIPIKDPKDHTISDIPNSMKEAIRIFILVKAIRMHRGDQNKHCTMMINPSSRNFLQEAVNDIIYDYLQSLKNNIQLNINRYSSKILNQMEQDYYREFLDKSSIDSNYPDWENLKKYLIKASQSVKTQVVNMKPENRGFDYTQFEKDGLTVIVIGGFALSRGLTLEGLCVSYIIRNASASDTLMQMGRWFGYREGYLDLCRIYLPAETNNLYRDITTSSMELIDEVETMATLNKTPAEYGLKVREHEQSIRITAANKMRSAELLTFAMGFSGKHVQGHSLYINNSINDNNRKAIYEFLNSLKKPDVNDGKIYRTDLFWSDVNVDDVMNLLLKFNFPPLCSHFSKVDGENSYIIDYINKCRGEVKNWDICLDNKIVSSNHVKADSKIIYGYSVSPREHHSGIILSEEIFQITSKQQVTASAIGSARYGLEKNILGVDEKGKEIIGNTSDYNRKRTKPLLLIHVFDGKSKVGGKDRNQAKELKDRDSKPIKNNMVTLTINFPFGLPTSKIQYQANKIYQYSLLQNENDEDRAEDDDLINAVSS
jgi:hypothetical protein